MRYVTTPPAENQPVLIFAWQHLSRTDSLIYHLISHADALSQAQLIVMLDRSPRQIRRSAKVLANLGLIKIDRAEHHPIYKAITKRTAWCPDNTTSSISTSQSLKTNITKDKTSTGTDTDFVRTESDPSPNPDQLILIEDDQAQNLGTLDIPAQAKLDFVSLGINKDVTQPFETASRLNQKLTPAKILMHHDSGGVVAQNLAVWAEAHRSGKLDLTYRGKPMKPALIWVKICEGQGPPLLDELEVAWIVPDNDGVITAGQRPIAEDERVLPLADQISHDVPEVSMVAGANTLSRIGAPVITNVATTQDGASAQTRDTSETFANIDAEPPQRLPRNWSLEPGADQADYGHSWGVADAAQSAIPTADDADICRPPNAAERAKWNQVIQDLSYQSTRQVFTQRYRVMTLVGVQEDSLVIDAGSEVNREWLDRRLHPVVARCTRRVFGDGLGMRLKFRFHPR